MFKLATTIIAVTFTIISVAQTEISVEVTKKGFEPAKIKAEAGKPVTLNITRKTKVTCAKEIVVPSLDLEKKLPLNKTVSLTITPKEKGEISFGCGMNQMVGGVIVVN